MLKDICIFVQGCLTQNVMANALQQKKKKDLPVVLDKHILGFNAGAELFWGGGFEKGFLCRFGATS